MFVILRMLWWMFFTCAAVSSLSPPPPPPPLPCCTTPLFLSSSLCQSLCSRALEIFQTYLGNQSYRKLKENIECHWAISMKPVRGGAESWACGRLGLTVSQWEASSAEPPGFSHALACTNIWHRQLQCSLQCFVVFFLLNTNRTTIITEYSVHIFNFFIQVFFNGTANLTFNYPG